MAVAQGELYWVSGEEPVGSEPGYTRPYLIVQSNAFNESALRTVVACALTSNLRHAEEPGNVLLRVGEGGLRDTSVVNVTQLVTFDRRELGARVGQISTRKLREVVFGLHLLFTIDDDVEFGG